jgi:hypothetical protein
VAGINPYRSNKDLGVTDYYFIDLVLMLASSAKIDLAELVHPYYKDKDLNLPRARTTVNMINSLVKKTAGNLNNEEKKVLREVLDDLQKTYVEKAKLDKIGGASSTPATKTGSSQGPRPLLTSPAGGPAPAGKPNVKEWISMVQQEIAKKKQTTK